MAAAAREATTVTDALPAKRTSKLSPSALLTAAFRWKTFTIGLALIALSFVSRGK